MPCMSYGESTSSSEYEDRIQVLESMLCHAFTVAEDQIFNAPPEVYAECGTKLVAMQEWWNNHQAEDQKRRERERDEKWAAEKAQEIREQRQRALDAMPPDVRRLFEF